MGNLNSYWWINSDKCLENAKKRAKKKLESKRVKSKRKRRAEKKKKRFQSDKFLQSQEWRKLRYAVLKKYGGRCMLCGRSAQEGAVLNVDHIKNRRDFPELALDPNNLQVLCGACNHGKGNTDSTDWRPTNRLDFEWLQALERDV